MTAEGAGMRARQGGPVDPRRPVPPDVQGPAAGEPPAEAARTADAGRDPAPPAEEPGAGEVVPGAAPGDAPEVPQPADRSGRGDPGSAGDAQGDGRGRPAGEGAELGAGRTRLLRRGRGELRHDLRAVLPPRPGPRGRPGGEEQPEG